MNTDMTIALQMLAQEETTSWDWEADLKFARAVGFNEEVCELIQATLKSYSPLVIAAWHAGWKRTVTARRTRALAALVRLGLASSSWLGLGAGAKSEFGTGRVRSYCITALGRVTALDRGLIDEKIKITDCGSCPNMQHRGGFGAVAYIPWCTKAGRDLPYSVGVARGSARVVSAPQMVANPTYEIPDFCPLENDG